MPRYSKLIHFLRSLEHLLPLAMLLEDDPSPNSPYELYRLLHNATTRSRYLERGHRYSTRFPSPTAKTPLTSKQAAAISATISNQCFTSALYSETRFDHVLCSPKQGHVSLHCTQHASPCLHRNTIDLETRRAEDRPGEEGIREMSRETERTSDSRLKVNDSHT